MNVFLNTFRPLCRTKFGREASQKHGIPPFVDGSCRREPDFENPYPAISEICRPGKLVKRLNEGDLIVYMTVKGSYYKDEPHYRLIAILEVLSICKTQEDAEKEYKSLKISTSQNLMVKSTRVLPYSHTSGWQSLVRQAGSEEKAIKVWDNDYRKRARAHQNIAITKVWNNHLNLKNPPIVTKEQLEDIFNRVPGTRSGYKMKEYEWQKFRIELKL